MTKRRRGAGWNPTPPKEGALVSEGWARYGEGYQADRLVAWRVRDENESAEGEGMVGVGMGSVVVVGVSLAKRAEGRVGGGVAVGVE